MGEQFKRLLAMLMAENIQFDLLHSPFSVWFLRDNSVPYEEHSWEIDDMGDSCSLWIKANGYSRSIRYETDEDYLYAIKKSLGGK